MVIIKNITLKTSIRLFMMVSTALGVTVGIVAFVGSLLGLPTRTTMLLFELKGVPAGTAALVLAPVLFSLIGFFMGVIGYLPLRLILTLVRGLRLEGDIITKD